MRLNRSPIPPGESAGCGDAARASRWTSGASRAITGGSPSSGRLQHLAEILARWHRDVAGALLLPRPRPWRFIDGTGTGIDSPKRNIKLIFSFFHYHKKIYAQININLSVFLGVCGYFDLSTGSFFFSFLLLLLLLLLLSLGYVDIISFSRPIPPRCFFPPLIDFQ